MVKIPSDEVTAAEASELIKVFGTKENFLRQQRAWMWRQVEKYNMREARKAGEAGMRAKFPVIAPPASVEPAPVDPPA